MTQFPPHHLGRHVLAEFMGCDSHRFDDVAYIEHHMKLAAEEANATIIESCFHRFSPYGVSGVVVISESHLTIHTWPENGYAAVDVFTCGDDADPWIALECLRQALGAKHVDVSEVPRGPISKIAHFAPRHEAMERMAAPG